MLIKKFFKVNLIILLFIIIIRFLNYIYKITIKTENTTDIHFKKNTWENNYMFGVFDYKKKK